MSPMAGCHVLAIYSVMYYVLAILIFQYFLLPGFLLPKDHL